MEMRAAQSSNIDMTGPEHIVMAASSDHIEGMELNHPTPHLLQVPTVMHDAYVIQKTIQELDESDYREKDLPQFFILLSMTCNILQGFLQYIKKAKRFLNGRAYCSDCGVVLLSHQDEQNLVDEQLLGVLPDEPIPYYARRFEGQIDFENQIRVCVRELQRITLDSRNMLIDIHNPEAAGRLQPNLRRAASATSVSGISDAREDAYNSDAGGPTYTRARVRRSSTPSTRRKNRQRTSTPSTRRNNRQRTWRINLGHLVEVDVDDAEVEVTSATSTDSILDVRGEICEQCQVTRNNLATGAGSSGEGSGRDDDAGVNLIIDI